MLHDGFTTVTDGDIARPLQIICVKNVSDADIIANVTANIKLPYPRFTALNGILMCKHEPLAIVAGGPSVRKQIPEIKKFKNVMVCGSAHDFLVKQGIKPRFAITTDALPTVAVDFQHPCKETMYLVASQSHPSTVAALNGYNVHLWHFRDQCDDKTCFNGEQQLGWGVTVGINALQLALIMGYQELHLFGYDGCAGDEDATHAYDVIEKRDILSQLEVAHIGDKMVPLRTTKAWIAQAEQFFTMVRIDGYLMDITVYGGGLIAEMVKQGNDDLKKMVKVA